MTWINTLLRSFFDLVLYPFRGLSPIWGLAVVSVGVGIVMLLIFKWTSNQEALVRVKRRIHAGFFEIRLFNDDIGAMFRAQGQILTANLIYLAYILVPLLWALIPLTLIYFHLDTHYRYAGLEPGESTLLEVVLKDDPELPLDRKPRVSLEVPAGLRVETPPVWVPAERELTWRISAVEPGDHVVEVVLGEERTTKSVRVSEDVVRRSAVRPPRKFIPQLENPGEQPIPNESPIESIFVGYPEAHVNLLGWDNWWVWSFLILSIAGALALKGVFGVTI